MSLIAWYPLNGNINNIGLNEASAASGGIVNNSGKIGKCYECKSSNYLTLPYIVDTTANYSICFWVKIPSTMSSNSSWETFFDYSCVDNGSNGTKPSSWAGYQNLKIYSSSNHQYRWLAPNTDFTYDNWFHLTLVHTAENTQTMYTYINGAYKYTNTSTIPLSIRSGNIRFGNGTATGSFFINDVRIYDHALSAKEVKEISKGLVLHYNFEDVCSNLIPVFSANSGQGVSIDNTTHPFNLGPIYKLSQSGNTSNVYRGLSYTIPGLKAGDVISMSCWIYTEDKSSLDSGAELRVFQQHNDSSATNWSGISWVGQQTNGKWCYYSRQYTLDSNLSSATFNANVVKNGTYWITGIKVEYGNIATSFDGYKETLSTIYDNSGYSNNATLQSTGHIIDSASMSGLHSLVFNGSNGLKTNLSTTTIGGAKNMTYTAWIYQTARNSNSYDRASICIGGTYFTITTAGYLSGYAYGKSPAGYHTGTHQIPLNTWTHVAIKWDDAYIYGYVNGTEDFKVACTGTFNNSKTQDIGWETSGGRYFIGKIADFKIYATALSAEDILAEYNRKAAIDRNGNLFTGEFIESNVSKVKVDKANFVVGNNIIEGADKVKFADKYTQLEYIQSNGNQYIDTEFIPTINTTRCIAEFIPLATSDTAFFGARNGNNPFYFFYNIGGNYTWPISQATKVSGSPTLAINTKYIVDWNKGDYKFYDWNYNLIEYATRSGAATCNTSMYIFNFQPTDSRSTIAKLYDFKIFDNDILIRHYIPAKRNSDNVIGLYDLINRKFYINKGSDSFTAGPEIGSISAIYANKIEEL